MHRLPIHTSSSGRLGLFENRCTSDERHQAVNQLDGKKEEHPLEFARLAHSFEKLEQTSSRLALIAILAELFRSIERPDEIEKVCYLLQGRVAPFFEALELGMAEKTVARSIAIAYHTTPEHVFTLYSALGDLGLVAEQLSKEAASVSRDLFVTVSKIGTGLTDEEWRSIRERTKGLVVDHKPARVSSLIEPGVWLEPKIVVEVLADEITRSPIHTAGKVGDEPGYALRFPRLVAFREKDKRPEDATTVEELIEMYQRQGKK